MEKALKSSTKLLKKQLASIDLSDIKKEKLSDAQVMSRAADIEILYSAHFEKILKQLIQRQMEFMAVEAKDIGQFLFGRGTVNGLMLVRDWFEAQVKLSRSRYDKSKEKEEAEPGEVFPPTT